MYSKVRYLGRDGRSKDPEHIDFSVLPRIGEAIMIRDVLWQVKYVIHPHSPKFMIELQVIRI